jgi:hypothetical protein
MEFGYMGGLHLLIISFVGLYTNQNDETMKKNVKFVMLMLKVEN